MSFAGDLVTSSGIGLSLLAGPTGDRTLRDVIAVESLADLRRARRGSLVVVIRSAAMSAPGYELDVAIRQASDHHLAALILIGRTDLPMTSRSLASRAGLPVFGAAADLDVADLVLRIDRIIRGGAADTLARAEAALDVIGAIGPDATVEELIERASRALSVPLEYAADTLARPDVLGTVAVRGSIVGAVRPTKPAQLDDAGLLVLPALVAAVERLLDADFGRRFAPARSRADLLAQLLVAEGSQLPMLVAQARDLGLQVEQVHIAVAVHARLQHGSAVGSGDVARQRRTLDAMELAALQGLPRAHGEWNVARPVGSLMLVHTVAAESSQLGAQVRRDVQRLLDRFRSDHGQTLAVGMGAAHSGLEGLRQSAHEADAAAEAAFHASRFGVVGVFDATGVRRIVAELGASALTRRMFADALAPLDALGADRSRRLVQTLAAYLDAQCSPSQAARALNLHPNAVAYRIRQITTALGQDLFDADSRLVLHLACRSRLLDQSATAG